MNEAQEAAAAERELARIYRSVDRRNARRKPTLHPLMSAQEVCQLFGFRKETLRRRVEAGRLPPPCNKAISAPVDPTQRATWQRDHRRWNRRLMEAISWGVLPEVTHTFSSPADWIEFLRDFKEFA